MSKAHHILLTWMSAIRASSGSLRAILGYVLIAAILFAPLLGNIGGYILTDDAMVTAGESDSYNSLWSYWWTQKALLLGQGLLHCDWVLPPGGADLSFHTTSILPAILTLPMALVFGTVAGYNIMVLLLIVFAAWMYYYFLAKTFDLSFGPAFLAGALFAFCPYFLYKAHTHINLIGAVFWGGALAVLLFAHLRNRFTLLTSLLFAAAVWATFWTSLVEFFMLAIMCSVLMIALLIFQGKRLTMRQAARVGLFLVPAAVGAVSGIPYFLESKASVVSIPLFESLSIAGIFDFPRLGFFAGWRWGLIPEYWGVYLPLSVLVLSIVGMVWAYRTDRRLFYFFSVVSVVGLALVVDVAGVPSRVLRLIPMGEGFRVMARFFPIFLFFLLIFAAKGIERVATMRAYALRNALIAVVLIVAIIEYYPVHLCATPVKTFAMRPEIARHIDRDAYVWFIPKFYYLKVHDTYQVDMNMRFVSLSFLAREDDAVRKQRVSRFPIVYGNLREVTSEQLYGELRALGVTYLLIESAEHIARIPVKGRIVAQDRDQVLLEVTGTYPPPTAPGR